MKNILLIILLLTSYSLMNASPTNNIPQLKLELHASGLEEPVDIANAGDKRLFVVEKDGIIKVVSADGEVSEIPFLDIDAQVNSGATERGLLGLVFHPDYANNGYFYVNYISSNGNNPTHISRFSVSANNPDVADPNSETILMAIPQVSHTHNGGDLNFGPDGYLYIGMGDGGMSGDPFNRAQNRQVALGKILRIDVDNRANGLNYGIPPDNPFVNDMTTLDEIWALGLRNPWRFSFDRLTGDMWIGDVGQDVVEEINFQPAASTGGENYGWRCYEGSTPFNPADCADVSVYTLPIHTYPNDFTVGCSVTGGFVYRGEAESQLYGHYIYADYCSGRFWSLYPDGNGGWIGANIGDFTDEEYSTFGENKDGELYVAAYAEGKIYRLAEICSDVTIDLAVTDESCEEASDGAIDMTILNAAPPYTIEWSTSDTSEDLAGLSPGTYLVTVTDANSCEMTDQATVNTNTLEAPTVTPAQYIGCEGDTVTLTASEAPEGYGYQWFDGLTDEPITDATAQTLTLTEGINVLYYVKYIGDCSSGASNWTDISFFNVPTPVIFITPDDNLEMQGAAAFYYDNPFTWYLNGEIVGLESCPGIGNDQWCVQPVENGNYVVCTTYFLDGAACPACSEPFYYGLINTENIIGIDDIQISPIPADDILNIHLATNQSLNLNLTLQNTQGQILMEKETLVSGNWTNTWEVGHLPKGVYFVVIQSEDGIMARKIVK